jgi:SAM-dependent methyltransferase
MNRPYRELAVMYDEMVGQTAFECWRDLFEQIRSREGLRFEVAADIACGTGLAAAYLSGMCSKVYAVDISPEMLKVARARAGAEGIVFLERSMTDFQLPERVDLLTCNFDSMNYLLEEDEIRAALDCFARALKDGGYCLFDLNTTREFEVEWGTSVFVHRVSNGIGLWETEWDPSTRINTLRMTNFIKARNGLYRMSEETHRERSYDVEFVLRACRDCGLSRVEAYDAKGLTGIDRETRRVQFVARKQGFGRHSR